YQTIHPYLPMSYAVTAMREVIFDFEAVLTTQSTISYLSIIIAVAIILFIAINLLKFKYQKFEDVTREMSRIEYLSYSPARPKSGRRIRKPLKKYPFRPRSVVRDGRAFIRIVEETVKSTHPWVDFYLSAGIGFGLVHAVYMIELVHGVVQLIATDRGRWMKGRAIQ